MKTVLLELIAEQRAELHDLDPKRTPQGEPVSEEALIWPNYVNGVNEGMRVCRLILDQIEAAVREADATDHAPCHARMKELSDKRDEWRARAESLFVVKLVLDDDDDNADHFGPFETNDDACAYGAKLFKNLDREDADCASWESIMVHAPETPFA